MSSSYTALGAAACHTVRGRDVSKADGWVWAAGGAGKALPHAIRQQATDTPGWLSVDSRVCVRQALVAGNGPPAVDKARGTASTASGWPNSNLLVDLRRVRRRGAPIDVGAPADGRRVSDPQGTAKVVAQGQLKRVCGEVMVLEIVSCGAGVVMSHARRRTCFTSTAGAPCHSFGAGWPQHTMSLARPEVVRAQMVAALFPSVTSIARSVGVMGVAALSEMVPHNRSSLLAVMP